MLLVDTPATTFQFLPVLPSIPLIGEMSFSDVLLGPGDT